MLHQPSGRNGPSPQRRKYTKKYDQIAPSSSQASPTLWGNHCGSDNRDCHTHTHTQTRRTFVPKAVATPLTSGCVPGPDIATVWTCPTPVYIHTARPGTNNTHTQPGSSCCVPFCDPHVHKETRSTDTKQECSHSSANTLVPVHHVARTHQINDKSKERKKKGVHQQRVLC